MRYTLFLSALLTCTTLVNAQQQRKLVIVTFDGLRWKDVFRGADSSKLFGTAFMTRKDTSFLRKTFWNADQQQRRDSLMPFFWSTIAKKGQVYGNRDLGSLVNVKNPFRISYPGYNEIFTGFPDPKIKSNASRNNPNVTLQQFVNKLPGFEGSVAVFASWACHNFILNDAGSGLKVVNAGFEPFPDASRISPKMEVLNEVQMSVPKTFGNTTERPDIITWLMAKEYMMKNHPRVLQVSFIETDAFAHRKKYDDYLTSTRNCDAMLQDLWNTIQSDPFYKDQTTLFITTDHGRGDGPGEEWSHHNSKEPESEQVWFAVMGPYSPALGEVKHGQVYQCQHAQTMAKLLGVEYKPPHETGPVIATVLGYSK